MKPISTLMHGLIDYATAGTLLMLPRMLGASPGVACMLTQAAIGTVGYSMATRYELSVFKLLPMKGHFALDGMQGLLMCGAPFLFPMESGRVRAALAGIGVFELLTTAMTQTAPGDETLLASTADTADRFMRDTASQARDRLSA